MSWNPIPGPPGPDPYSQPPPQPQLPPPPMETARQLKRTVSPVTRRRFLTFCGVVGTAGIAAGATQVH